METGNNSGKVLSPAVGTTALEAGIGRLQLNTDISTPCRADTSADALLSSRNIRIATTRNGPLGHSQEPGISSTSSSPKAPLTPSVATSTTAPPPLPGHTGPSRTWRQGMKPPWFTGTSGMVLTATQGTARHGNQAAGCALCGPHPEGSHPPAQLPCTPSRTFSDFAGTLLTLRTRFSRFHGMK